VDVSERVIEELVELDRVPVDVCEGVRENECVDDVDGVTEVVREYVTDIESVRLTDKENDRDTVLLRV
jgi:Na+/phosphate symporter